MTLLRVPVVNQEQLQTLRGLLRLDFVRALQVILIKDKEVTPQCLSILSLVDIMNQTEQPLVMLSALMVLNGTPTAVLPLSDAHFKIYSDLIEMPLRPEDFTGITKESMETFLGSLRGVVTELKEVFKAAGHMEEEALRSKMKTTAASTGMMN